MKSQIPVAEVEENSSHSKMSLDWSKQKSFTTKFSDLYLKLKPFDLKYDEGFPQELRNSLFSLDSFQIDVQDELTSESNEEETWESIDDCGINCSNSTCPFRNEISDESSVESVKSEQPLLRTASSMSAYKLTAFEQSSFLTITKVMPVLNHCVISWSVKSTYGVRGYMVNSQSFS